MVEDTDRYDPDATIWRAVASLERKGYTKAEISVALEHVAEQVDPSN